MSIVCVTPNIAVDRTLRVPGFREGGVWRASEVHVACGGKGVNVARALHRLKERPVCAGMLGGGTGRLAVALAEAEGLPARWTSINGETRTSVIVVGDGGRSTVVNEPGPAITEADWTRFVDDVTALAAASDTACISGSLPPGCAKGGLARLIASLSAGGRPVWVDTSGAFLAEAIAAAPFGIKINGDEAAAITGRPVGSPAEAAAAAAAIRSRGALEVAITLGEEGAVLAGSAGTWHAAPPAVRAVSAVGSGDCFLAGLLAAGRREDAKAADRLRLAVACGTANAQRLGIALPEDAELDALQSATRVRLLSN